MQSVMFPEFPRLQGEEAIEALHNFIEELNEKGNKELTKKQTKTLKKLAKGIIASIESTKNEEPQNKEMGFALKIRNSIVRYVQKSGRSSENRGLLKVA
jgi:hypothetical protein